MTTADQYLSAQVLTASPYQLHLMVIRGAMQFGEYAAECLDSENWEEFHLACGQSRDFVAELIGGLDEEADKEIVSPLRQLFAFAYKNLAEGERDRDGNQIRDALQVLNFHLEAWLELGEKIQQDDTPSPPTPSKTTPTNLDEPQAWSA